MPEPRLGPFRLGERIGRGGLADVHRASYIPTGDDVAIKLLRPRALASESLIAEVAATARLDHPGVVRVLDYGEVSTDDAARSDGLLAPGGPFIVMELVPGRSIHRDCGRLGWARLRDVLAGLLRALAHAHARGVLHCDLKPGNVLWAGRRRVKLVDFGIARALGDIERAAGSVPATGTPAFMAPEQLEARTRDLGPWTDLYAVGCTAQALATGEPPFGWKGDLVDIAMRHLHDLPPRVSLPGWPAGLSDWIGRLLAKQTTHRYQLAADALAALERIEDAPGAAAPGFGVSPPDAVTTRPDVAPSPATVRGDLPATSERRSARTEPASSPPPSPVHPAAAEAPPPPAWEEAVRRLRPRSRPPAADVRMFGLYEPPIVGRQAERDRLWTALREVHDERMPRAALVRGAAGTGKSRLARWLCETAHEGGHAIVLRANHGPMAGPTDGVAGMVAAFARCIGLDRRAALARIAELLAAHGEASPDRWASLVELMTDALEPASEEVDRAPTERIEDEGRDAPASRFSTAGERHALVVSFLRSLASARPVVVWIDDAQWGADALELASFLLARQRSELPVLVIATVREEGLVERPIEHALVEALAAQPRVTEIELGPLPASEHRDLVRNLLGVRGELARRIEERTAGNPLFAVHVIRDWIARGALLPTPDGLDLREGETLALPSDLRAFWSGRLRAALTGLPPAARPALAVAAALGQEVDREEHARVCRALGTAAPDGLEHALVRNKLAETRAFGWSFAHEMIRACIEEEARRGDRWREVHLACAAVLRVTGGRGGPERMGRHLLEAGENAAAIEPLRLAVVERIRVCEHHAALRLLELRTAALDGAGAGPGDGRRAEGLVLGARCRARLGRYREAVPDLLRALPIARRAEALAVEASALSLLGLCALQAGRVARSGRLKRAALTRFERAGDDIGVLEALWGVAAAARVEGRLDEAETLYRRGLALARKIGDPVEQADCLRGLAQVALRRGDMAAAAARDSEALALYVLGGYRAGELYAHNGLAEIARRQGDLALAEAHYRSALEVDEVLGGSEGTIPRLNLAIMLVEAERHGEALDALDRVVEELEANGWTAFLPSALLWLMACAAGLGDFARWDEAAAELRPLVGATMRDPDDVARGAEIAYRMAERAGEQERGLEVLAIARRLQAAV